MVAILSILNQKGGAAKTTLAINLAAVLGDTGRRVIVIDADEQQSATRWAKQASTSDGKGFALGRDVHPVQVGKSAKVFRDEMDRLAAEAAADFAIIDCPPELTDPARVAALLSDMVLVPCTPSPLDVWAAEAAVELARDARSLKNSTTPLIALVPSKTQRHTILSREIAGTLARIGEPVTPAISQRVALAEAVIAGQTVLEYAPAKPAIPEFRAIGKFVLTALRKHANVESKTDANR
jgi:chromosome partitioning protein